MIYKNKMCRVYRMSENKKGGVLTAQDLIQKSEERKERAREAAKLYRANRKKKFEEEGNIDEYRNLKRIEMAKYRAAVSKRLLEAYAEIGDNPQQIQKQQKQIISQVADIDEILEDPEAISKRQQQQPKLKSSSKGLVKLRDFNESQKMRRVTPLWYNDLPKTIQRTAEDVKNAMTISKQPIRKQLIEQIDRLSRLVLGKALNSEVQGLIDKVLRAEPLNSYEMKVLRGTNKKISDKEGLWFINRNQIEPFIKKVAEKYPRFNTFKTVLNGLVNVLSRLPEKEWGNIYQYVSLHATEANEKSFADKKTGITSEEDEAKLFDFTEVGEKIKSNLNDDITKRLNKHWSRALAAVYGLQLPRRIQDYQFMKLDDTPVTSIDTLAADQNYLLVDQNKVPNTFVFKKYKTFKIYGTQVRNIIDKDLQRYLRNHIIHHKLKVGDYIFGSKNNNFKTINTGFINDLKEVFTKMFGSQITSRFIRSAAANTLWDTAESYEEIEEKTKEMGHDVLTSLSYRKNVKNARINKQIKQEQKKKQQEIEKKRKEKGKIRLE